LRGKFINVHNEFSKVDFNLVCKTFHIDIESAQCLLKTNKVCVPSIRGKSTACICLDVLLLKNEKVELSHKTKLSAMYL
jgi:hypothetical protein